MKITLLLRQALVLLMLIIGCQVHGQGVRVVDYSQLSDVMSMNNDTTYVINFWATWCKPCVAEMPYFEELHRVTKGQKVRVLLVSLDFPSQLESRVIPFVEVRGLKPEVFLLNVGDPNKWIDKVDPT